MSSKAEKKLKFFWIFTVFIFLFFGMATFSNVSFILKASEKSEVSEKEKLSEEKTEAKEKKKDKVSEIQKEKTEKKKKTEKKASLKKNGKKEVIKKEETKKEETKKEETKKEETDKKKKTSLKKKKAKKVSFNGKKVYLTFDDGPSENTDAVLKILDDFDVKGTFFVIGREDKASLKRYKTIVEKGHTIGLHSYTHNYKQIYASLAAFKKDYKRIDDLIYKTTGVRSNYYRFPGGSSNSVSPISMKVFADYFNKKGIRYYDWNVQCGDAVVVPPSPNTLYNNVIQSIAYSKAKEFIVLIHDSRPMKNSVKALPSILKWLKAKKYEILPIDDNTIQLHHRIVR